MTDANILLSPISVKKHPEWGAYIELYDYNHADYIEDVLIEKFDLEFEYKQVLSAPEIHRFFTQIKQHSIKLRK